MGDAGPANLHKLVRRRKSLECQLIGLASWRASVFRCSSNGEAGETLVDLLAGSYSELWTPTSIGSTHVWATAMQVDLSPIP